MYSNKKETSYPGTQQNLFHLFKKHKSLKLPTSASFLFYATCLIIVVSIYVLYPGNTSFVSDSRVHNQADSVEPQQNISSTSGKDQDSTDVQNISDISETPAAEVNIVSQPTPGMWNWIILNHKVYAITGQISTNSQDLTYVARQKSSAYFEANNVF